MIILDVLFTCLSVQSWIWSSSSLQSLHQSISQWLRCQQRSNWCIASRAFDDRSGRDEVHRPFVPEGLGSGMQSKRHTNSLWWGTYVWLVWWVVDWLVLALSFPILVDPKLLWHNVLPCLALPYIPLLHDEDNLGLGQYLFCSYSAVCMYVCVVHPYDSIPHQLHQETKEVREQIQTSDQIRSDQTRLMSIGTIPCNRPLWDWRFDIEMSQSDYDL